MEHPVLRAATVPLMLLVGALITLQSRVNASLAGQLGDGLRAGALAAVVSYGSGLVLLSAVVLSHPRRRAGLRRVLDALRDPADGADRPRLRPVHLLGGLGGATTWGSGQAGTSPSRDRGRWLPCSPWPP